MLVDDDIGLSIYDLVWGCFKYLEVLLRMMCQTLDILQKELFLQ